MECPCARGIRYSELAQPDVLKTVPMYISLEKRKVCRLGFKSEYATVRSRSSCRDDGVVAEVCSDIENGHSGLYGFPE